MLKNPASAVVARLAKPKEDKARYERLFAFQCRALRLPEFREQFMFAKQALGRQWRADVFFPVHGIVVEIQGGIWMKGGGAHSHPVDITRNMEKHNDIALLGLTLLQFTPKDVTSGEAVAFTQKVLAAKGWTGP